MPDSDVARMTARVPLLQRRELVRDLDVDLGLVVVGEVDLLTAPMRRPPICTSLSLTSWPAFWKRSL
jgi:hypothetical protein